MGCNHFCMDEVYGIFAVFAVIRYLPQWARAAWSSRHQKPTCHHGHKEKP